MAEHLVPNGADPQYEPGECHFTGSIRRSGLFGRKIEGYCGGCMSWQPAKPSLVGWRIYRHEPAEPQHANCGVPGHPDYPGGLSYTQPPCDECATATDQASYDRGDSVGGYADA